MRLQVYKGELVTDRIKHPPIDDDKDHLGYSLNPKTNGEHLRFILVFLFKHIVFNKVYSRHNFSACFASGLKFNLAGEIQNLYFFSCPPNTAVTFGFKVRKLGLGLRCQAWNTGDDPDLFRWRERWWEGAQLFQMLVGFFSQLVCIVLQLLSA